MSILLIVRHGESEWNSIGKLQGQYDSPLTQAGIQQAEAVARCLANMSTGQPPRIHTSPLSRARVMAEIIADALSIKRSDINIDSRLTDYDLGEFSGTYGWKVLVEDFPELERLRVEEPLRFQPPGGELGARFYARLQDFLNHLLDDDSTDLIVSHGVVNKYLRSIRRNLPDNQIIALSEGQDTIYRLNSTKETEIKVPESPILAPTNHVKVELGSRSYDIVVGSGLIDSAEAYLRPLVKGRRVALVSDETVLNLHLGKLAPQLDAVTSQWHVFRVTGGEKAKSFNGIETLLNQMLDDGIDRRCVVIAFGGGVVGDVAGFGANLLMRGIELIQIPTTLMSQVDSAVGGKNGINTNHGKNLVGSFLQPLTVLNDVSVLDTLSLTELRTGYAELFKYALLSSEQDFSWLEKFVKTIMSRHAPTLIRAISMGCRIKANIVSEDERDLGKRAYVNLGHTFAHAFEAHAGYGSFTHGNAVAVGVIAACRLSERINACAFGLADRVERHVRDAGLPANLQELSHTTDWEADSLYKYMLSDKKTFNGKIHFVLLHGIGKPFSNPDVEPEAVYEVLSSIGATI